MKKVIALLWLALGAATLGAQDSPPLVNHILPATQDETQYEISGVHAP